MNKALEKLTVAEKELEKLSNDLYSFIVYINENSILLGQEGIALVENFSQKLFESRTAVNNATYQIQVEALWKSSTSK